MATLALINILFALGSICALFGILRVLDWLSGHRFKTQLLPIIKQSPIALAIYRGAWVFSGAYLIGSMLGV